MSKCFGFHKWGIYRYPNKGGIYRACLRCGAVKEVVVK